MKKTGMARLLGFFWGLAVLILLVPNLVSGQNTEGMINCDIQHQSCLQKLATGTVTLTILPRPVKAMADLVFQVKVEGIQPTSDPFIDLGMPGMKMGRNHVELKLANPGEYTGTGVIVRCPSGRTVWRATVTIPDAGSADFIFDVIY